MISKQLLQSIPLKNLSQSTPLMQRKSIEEGNIPAGGTSNSKCFFPSLVAMGVGLGMVVPGAYVYFTSSEDKGSVSNAGLGLMVSGGSLFTAAVSGLVGSYIFGNEPETSSTRYCFSRRRS